MLVSVPCITNPAIRGIITFTSATSARASSLAIHQECFHVDGHVIQPEHHKHCRQKHYLSPPPSPPPYFHHCIMLLLPTSLDTPSFSPSAMNSLSSAQMQLLVVYSYTLPTISAFFPTFSSRLYADCDGQQNSRIATILLTCSINFSSLSTINVAGQHLLSSSATSIK